jgi:hypothetical protein
MLKALLKTEGPFSGLDPQISHLFMFSVVKILQIDALNFKNVA